MPLSFGIKKFGSVTSDPANITAATSLDHSLTIPGVLPGDLVFVTAPSLEANLTMSMAWVSAANTVKVRICNPTAGAINPASQTFNYWIM